MKSAIIALVALRDRRTLPRARAGRLRQIQMAARQGARHAQRHGFAQSRFGRPRHVADPLGDDRRARAVRRRQASGGAGTRAEIADILRRLPSESRAARKPAPTRSRLSSEGWIDVVQDGHAVKSAAFSGALGCEGVRKSVKFDLAAQPLTLELSGVPATRSRSRSARNSDPRRAVSDAKAARAAYCLSVLATLKLASVCDLI